MKYKVPSHLAIILDGNGRWAQKRGLPRNLGHYNGAINLFKIANHANNLGVNFLTVYAFSTENWNRPKAEVDYLMLKPLEYLNENIDRLKDISYKIIFVGRRTKLPKETILVIDKLESQTKNNKGMVLQIAFDYGSKEEIINAFNQIKKPYTEEKLREFLYVKEDVDLLIRTSGEVRLSNFLLWQNAYAELIFIKKHWPSFSKKDLEKSFKEYSKRNRRFGKL
jgi:undecaprenyl diphosphate synthase